MSKKVGLNQKIAGGVVWNIIGLIVNRAFGTVIKLLLARLLFPSDYGLIGMAVVFTSFAAIISEVGIGSALVQAQASKLKTIHLHTTFWASLVWACAVFAVLSLVVGPFAASFYNEPKLTAIVAALSISVLVGPLNTVHKAQLTRKFNFKRLTYISNSSSIVGGVVALIAAFLGLGVWALVIYSVVPTLVAFPMYFSVTKYYPKFEFSRDAFQDVFGFGITTMATSLANTFISQLDYLLVGKLVSKHALGVYTFAFVITDLVRKQLMAVLNSVMFPAYSAIQHDKKKLAKVYLKVVKYNAVVIYPLMAVLLVNTRSLITTFFGNKWIDSVLVIKILTVSVFFHMLVNSNTSLIRGMGKAKLELRLQLVKGFLIFAPSVYLGIVYFSIEGAAMAVMVNKLFAVPIAYYILHRLIDLKAVDILRELFPPIVATMLSLAAGYLLNNLGAHFVANILIMLAIYAAVIYLTMLDELKSIIQQIRARTGKKLGKFGRSPSNAS